MELNLSIYYIQISLSENISCILKFFPYKEWTKLSDISLKPSLITIYPTVVYNKINSEHHSNTP